MDFTLWLGIIAGLVHISAFVLYNKQVSDKTSTPNIATWTMWVVLTILNLFTYNVMSGDIVKSILPTISSIFCIWTFLFSLKKGRLSQMRGEEIIALVIGGISCFIWWWYHSATYANMILQVSIAISFIPTYRGVWNNPKIEKALPWYIWSAGYALSIMVVIFRWRDQYQDLVYPIGCLILHFFVGLLAERKPRT